MAFRSRRSPRSNGSAARRYCGRDANAIERIYLPDGRPPVAGEVFRNPDLARSLRAIARDGGEAFYRGEVAQAHPRVQRRITAACSPPADLSEYQAEWVTPLTTNYRGWDVYEIPPNSQGIAALVMLNILESFPLARLRPRAPPTRCTLMIEAKKLAYADMQRHVGDPALLDRCPSRRCCRKRTRGSAQA